MLFSLVPSAPGDSRKRLGRAAGATYLLMIVSAAFGYTTMSRILGGNTAPVSEGLLNTSVFPMAFWLMVVGFLAWVVLAYLLSQLMGSFGHLAAGLMFAFTAAGATVSLVAMSCLYPLLGPAAAADAAAVTSMTQSYDRFLDWIVSRAPGVPAMLGEIGMCLWLLVKGGSLPERAAKPVGGAAGEE